MARRRARAASRRVLVPRPWPGTTYGRTRDSRRAGDRVSLANGGRRPEHLELVTALLGPGLVCHYAALEELDHPFVSTCGRHVRKIADVHHRASSNSRHDHRSAADAPAAVGLRLTPHGWRTGPSRTSRAPAVAPREPAPSRHRRPRRRTCECSPRLGTGPPIHLGSSHRVGPRTPA